MARYGSVHRIVIVTWVFVAALPGCRSDPLASKTGSRGAGFDPTEAPPFSATNSPVRSGGASQRDASLTTGKGNSGEFDLLAGVKDGLEKVGELLTFTEPVQQAPDPTSLSTKAKPSPRLYVAMARLAEDARQPMNAEEYYRKALQLDPNFLDALLGLGRLKDREGKLDEALNYYLKATKSHPDSAAAWNHLGLCYARMGRSRDAVLALEKAIALAPREPRYRHNMATVLVQIGDLGGALRHLSSVHDEATACYNLGYLLVKKGHTAAALRYFNRAVELRPNFADAQAWRDALLNRNKEQGRGGAGTATVSDQMSIEPKSGPDPTGAVSSRSAPSNTGPALMAPPISGSLVAPLPPLDDPGHSSESPTMDGGVVRPLPPVGRFPTR